MLTLQNVFSDNALFLHSSVLEIKGNAEKCEDISIKLIRNSKIIGEWSEVSDENGHFTVAIDTPAASYNYYDISVKTENEEKILKDILFGELWLACGQSNMEMSNTQQPEWLEVLELIKDKKIRAFQQPRLTHTDDYPFEPSTATDGGWRKPTDENFIAMSAIATKFSNNLYDFFAARGEDCPVGFLNTSRGGTCIETWIPRESFAKYERIAHRTPKLDTWNTKGENNYQQPAAHYNFHMAPLIGVKARGMLWYQGESNVGMENTQHLYKDYMTALRDSYKERFAPSDNDIFPMMSVQLFPWKYSEFNDTKMGYMNKAFSDMAKKYPDEYPFVPICDLPFLWCKWAGNHPIHPIHKYRIADRLSLLAQNKYYGRKVKNIQMLPPMLKSSVRHGNKLRLTFENVGSGLYIKGQKARGLYIRSKDGVYTPAYCEIVAKNVMNVYHPYIDKPCHVAYSVSSLEPKTNIFAGEFPVTPFCTEFADDVSNEIRIGKKPWLNNENDGEFSGQICNTYFDFFNAAIFNPACGSGVCYDSDFAVTARSLRVYAIDHSDKKFGAYIRAGQYEPLDFENYKELKFALYHHRNLEVKFILYYKEKDGTSLVHSINATAAENGKNGWFEHSVDLSGIPVGEIEKAEFSFTRGADRLSYVFLDDIVLVPKK